MARTGLRPGYRLPLLRFDLADAGTAIHRRTALSQARIDMGGGRFSPRTRRVEEDIEHAAGPGKLQLARVAFGKVDARGAAWRVYQQIILHCRGSGLINSMAAYRSLVFLNPITEPFCDPAQIQKVPLFFV